ncbi:MAG TPA: hypothetical protein VKV19_01330 [Ktedonobacteraceae bacterium]|nr:hypothetical protein [Ktedonobacteraceae bacterium]
MLKKGHEPILIEVLVREPRCDSPVYTWDAERTRLRLTGVYRARPGLPADLAILPLEGKTELPVLLLHHMSIAPETYVQACLLGALFPGRSAQHHGALPAEGWVFIAAVYADEAFSAQFSLDTLPPVQQAALRAYLREQVRGEQGEQPSGETDSTGIETCDAGAAARLIRETRLFLKREQRARSQRNAWFERNVEEKPVAWRAVEGLAESLRLAVQRDALFAHSKEAPHAQAEHLIRFVPQRFQHALARLLLDDERLLAFVERPLLRHRTGPLGLQTWRSNEGLFLVTDRQALWLRDFTTPGSTFAEGGYIARMVPLERLRSITVLAPGSAPGAFAGRLDASNLPYQRLVLEVEGAGGVELLTIEFPHKAEVEKALARMRAILHAFLPLADGSKDRRLRRLPVVEIWMPQGTEAARLAGLGGIVPAALTERLKQQLAESTRQTGEEILVSVLVPALEGFRTPARLVALTHQALLVIDDDKASRREAKDVPVQRYALSTLSSAQLEYSLLGSGLSLFVPQLDGHTRRLSVPFNSPAIAWFLPLFTRLRLLLSGSYYSK